MIEVIAHGWHVPKVIEIVGDLKQKGYALGTDFDYVYNKPKHDDTTYQLVYNRHTVFTFYNESLATWFSLTYL